MGVSVFGNSLLVGFKGQPKGTPPLWGVPKKSKPHCLAIDKTQTSS